MGCSELSDRFSERKERAEHGRLRTQAETEAAKEAAKVAAAATEERGKEMEKNSA
jgi:arsenic resistance protein ArsH